MVDRSKSSIKHWPEGERPRERLIKFGSDKLSDAQLRSEYYSFVEEGMI